MLDEITGLHKEVCAYVFRYDCHSGGGEQNITHCKPLLGKRPNHQSLITDKLIVVGRWSEGS